MSFEKRRTATVLKTIKDLVAGGKSSLRPGDVCAVLREKGMPMGAWEVRAEFTRLEAAALVQCNAETGDWHLTEGASLQQDAAG